MNSTKIEPKYITKSNPRVGLIALASEAALSLSKKSLNLKCCHHWNQFSCDWRPQEALADVFLVQLTQRTRFQLLGKIFRIFRERAKIFCLP